MRRDVLDRLHARLGRVDGVGASAHFAEALLRARARRLAMPRDGGGGAVAGKALLCCRIAAERYGLALDELSEVMELESWTPVPGQPQYLLGVTNLRGEIRPVLDLHALLGLPAPDAGARAWVIFADSGGSEVGLRVDALESIAAVDAGSLTVPADTGNGLPQRFVAGIGSDGLIVLDIGKILALDVLQDRRVDARHVS